ncbi:hypothetical protein [Bdellovibrio bacteriovorus]|uniref:Uncharacterized protein n=1 Tax=Bdellovibrio bacteriovorus TaxID=959 RepID=A0A1Z3N718_BDEBC|nr:hypothetical protein [Bdellovibrio bacteriovorus]ASD63270.1 hypothetical protein B9G79_06655 [Bdellovibrio bacteriovorus]
MKSFVLILCLMIFPIFAEAAPSWYPMPKEAYKFGEAYPEAQQLLYAFDYGHALVYERLLHNKGKIANPKEFEKEILRDILVILKNPPPVKVDEDDIAPEYVFTFPLMVNAFDWSHMLHQWVLDVLATSEDRGEGMHRRINEIFVQYKANRSLAITDVCKTMLFMDGHYFSKDFRRSYPSFNLLIWSYHWFQIRLYEALMKPHRAERDLAVQETVKEFWTLISDLPDSAEFDMMPETAKEAPTFARQFPLIAAAFDNNHMLHDIVSDILTSNKVAAVDMRKLGVEYGRMALDPQSFKSNKCAAYP